MSNVGAETIVQPATPPVAEAVDYDNPLHEKYAPTFRRLVLPPHAESRFSRLLTMALALGIASLYLYALLCYWAPAHPGVDQNGYFVGGREFAHTLSTGITQTSDYEFIGRMYIRADSGENFPKYPIGLPILFAFCIWLQPLWNVFHWDGHDVAHLISPVSAALATLGMFAFVRRLAGGFLGLVSMIALGASNVMLILAINPNSHALGTCLTVWSFYLMVRWLETGTLWRGVACAFLLGYAYLVRYTEGLQAVPLAFAMLFAAVWWRPAWRRSVITIGSVAVLSLLTLGITKWLGDDIANGKSWLKPLFQNQAAPVKGVVGLVVAAALVSIFIHPRSLWRLLAIGMAWLGPVLYQTIFNMVEMGSFTSYAGTNESTGFHIDYFVANWEKMVRILNDQGLFFLAPIGLIGLLAMFRSLPVVATIIALWFTPSVLLYTAYYWAPDQWGVAYSRFILTELPALIISGAWLMGYLLRSIEIAHLSVPMTRWNAIRARVGGIFPRIAIGAAIAVAAGVASYRAVNGTEWGMRIIPRANLEAQSIENKNLAQLGKAVRDVIKSPDAVVFADGERLHHLQWLSRWQMFPADGFNPETARRQYWRSNTDEGDPDPFDMGRVKFMRDVYDGKNQADLIAEQNKIMDEALRAGRQVFLVLNEPTTKAFIDKFISPPKKKAADSRFETKVRGVVVDIPMPVLPEELLDPSQQRKMPIGRGGKQMVPPQLNRTPLARWQIVEVIEKTPAATQPATQPANLAEAK